MTPSTLTSSPIDRRLVELRLLGTPDQAEELAFLEEYHAWKSANGPKEYEAKRAAECLRQFENTNRLLRWDQPRPKLQPSPKPQPKSK